MTQGELERIPQEVVQQMSELEIRIMTDIVRRIKANGFSTASADWQFTRLRQLGQSEADIKKWVQEALQASDAEIDRIFSDEVYKEYYGHERSYRANGMDQVPYEQNAVLQQLIEAMRRQTQETFRNMSNCMGFALKNPATGKLTYSPLKEFYQSTLDNAMWDIHSGAFDYQTVLKRTIQTMTNSGLRWIDYDSGWHNRVDVAARRAVMTGFRQVQGKINEQVAEQLGTDQYETTAHVGARPTHQPWQGRIWSMQQLIDVCGLGDILGLHGINCYHDYRAFPPGSIRTYTDEQLEEMMERENTPKEYNGKQYTTYEALQQQRKMETAMRATRQQIKLLQEGGSDAREIMLKKAKYQGQMQAYKDFSKKMGLPEQIKRVYQDGLGTSGFKVPRAIANKANSMYDTGSESSNVKAYYRDLPLREKIQSAETNKQLEPGQYRKHVPGTLEYKQYQEKYKRQGQYGPSYLTIGEDITQSLVDKYSGTGVLRWRKGRWLNEEIITVHPDQIGVAVNNLNGIEADTTVFKIKYGKNGTHVVPDYPSKKGAKGK